jgi:hypothetical protein
VAFLYGTMLAMAHDRMIVKPGDDARTAERVVALLTKYAVRFDPVDRITFYSGIVRRLAPIRQGCKRRCAPTILDRTDPYFFLAMRAGKG